MLVPVPRTLLGGGASLLTLTLGGALLVGGASPLVGGIVLIAAGASPGLAAGGNPHHVPGRVHDLLRRRVVDDIVT